MKITRMFFEKDWPCSICDEYENGCYYTHFKAPECILGCCGESHSQQEKTFVHCESEARADKMTMTLEEIRRAFPIEEKT